MTSAISIGKIGVLMGGYSSEREISLKSGHGVAEALTNAGYQVERIDITSDDHRDITQQLQKSGIDVAFIALHGRLGEDGVIQSILESLGIRYTGPGVLASQRAFNKVTTQTLLKNAGLPVPPNVCISDGRMIDFKQAFAVLKKLPFVLKAGCEGSSIGVFLVRHPSQWQALFKDALAYGPYVIVEQFIKGREVTAGIFNGQPLPLVEIVPKSKFFDFNAKYTKGQTEYEAPAQLPEAVTKKVQDISLKACQVLGCEVFSRVDVRLDEQLNPYILEVNTIPGFTETSLFPKAARVAGYSFTDVCVHLIRLAYEQKK